MAVSNELKQNLEFLNEEDLLNNILYLIYKLSDDSKYSVISELIYVLGKDSLFKLCSVLGGCEIKIPTITELKLFTGALYIFYATQFENISFDVAYNRLNLSPNFKKSVATIYKEIYNKFEPL